MIDRIKEAKDEAKQEDEEKDESFKRPTAPEYSKKKAPVEKIEKKIYKPEQPKIMLENRSIQEIEEEKRIRAEEAACVEMYEDKCYTPPLIDRPPPKVEIVQAALELLQLDEKRKLVRSDQTQIKSAVKTVKVDALDEAFLKEAQKGIKINIKNLIN